MSTFEDKIKYIKGISREILLEDKRSELIGRGRRGKREKGDGKTRYEKRVKSSISTSTREYNQINMNELFKNGILTVRVPVRGETSDYLVTMKFGSFTEHIQKQLVHNKVDRIDVRIIVRALMDAFNVNDVYIRCTCPDFQYRQAYWLSVDDVIEGEKETRPSDITNPNNDLGPGCKHVMLVLANAAWILKVANTVNNYIKYFINHREKEYADIIYPALYGKKYEEPVQLSLDDSDELTSDTDVIDTANEIGRKSGQFKKGNPYRYRPKVDEPAEGQLSVDDIIDMDEDEPSEET